MIKDTRLESDKLLVVVLFKHKSQQDDFGSDTHALLQKVGTVEPRKHEFVPAFLRSQGWPDWPKQLSLGEFTL